MAIPIPIFIAILIAILFPSSLWGIPGSYTSFWFLQLILVPGGPERFVCARALLVCARVCFSWPVCARVSVFASFVVVCARTGKPTSLEELCRASCSPVLMLSA